MIYKKLLKLIGIHFINIWRFIIFLVIAIIFYYIYFKYSYLYFMEHNVSYTAMDKLKKANIIYDWAKIEYRSHLYELRKLFYLKDHIHSFKIFSEGKVPIWPLYMNDLYYWCFTPFSWHIKTLKFLNLEGQSYSFVLEEIYKARRTVYFMENKFYLSMRANMIYISMEEFTFHSIHHHWLFLEMQNEFATFMKVASQQKCKEFTFKPCYDMMFAIDYLNYHIAMAQAKIDAMELYKEDLHLLQGFKEDLDYFLELKKNLKFYACGNQTTTIEDLHYISKADFKNLACEKAFYNETFEKYLQREVLVMKEKQLKFN